MSIEIIYCGNGNARFAKIAIDAGFTYGAQMPGTVYFEPDFIDQDWKNPVFDAYMQKLISYRPQAATVLDLEKWSQLPRVIWWMVNAAQHVRKTVVVIPKVSGIINHLPREINGKEVRLGYSVPTKFSGTIVPIWEFLDRPVHLLGGSPHHQFRLSKYLNVISVDGNMHNKMAVKFCAFYDPAKTTKRGYWPTINDYDGKRWGNGINKSDAPYEAFRRSCENIMAMWNSR